MNNPYTEWPLLTEIAYMPLLYRRLIAILIFLVSFYTQASERAHWESVLSKALNRDQNSALILLQDRYASLPPNAEKLYIASRIHHYMVKRNQPYYGSETSTQSNYTIQESRFIEGLNAEQALDYRQAEQIYLDLYQQMTEKRDIDGEILLEYHLCKLLNIKGEYFKGQFYCQKMDSNLKQSTNPVLPKYRGLQVIANNLEFIGDYKSALDTYKHLIEQMPGSEDPSGVYNDIGLVLCTLGQYQQALDYLYRALTLRVEKGDKPGIAQVEYSLGDVYYHKGDYKHSIDHFNKARLTLDTSQDLHGLAYVHLGLGKAYTTLSDFHLGNEHLMKALDYIVHHQDMNLKIEIYLALSDSYLTQQYIKQANYYALKARTLSEQAKNARTTTQSLRQLAKIADLRENHALALSYYRQYVQSEIAIRNTEHRKAFEALDLTKSNLEHQIASSELVVKNENFRREISLIALQRTCLITFIIVTIILAVLLLRRAAKTRKTEQLDCLTNAYNRTACIKKVQKLRAPNEANNRNLIILFDLDHLRAINTKYGYTLGNDILINTVNIVNRQLKKNDFVSRLGGNEFLIFLQDVDDCEIHQRVEELHQSISTRSFYAHRQTPLYVSASFAFLATAKTIKDFDDIYPLLDQALYQAKHNGPNAIIDAYSDPIDYQPSLA